MAKSFQFHHSQFLNILYIIFLAYHHAQIVKMINLKGTMLFIFP